MISISPSLIAYGFGVLFGILAILYFARDILLSLSVTTKSILMYATSLSLISFAIPISIFTVSVVVFLLAGVTYAVASFYTIKWYDWKRLGRFILFSISSILFIVLGLILSERVLQNLTLSQSGLLTLFLGLVSMIFVVADRRESENMKYEITTKDSVEGENPQIGTLRIENRSPVFRRKINIPNFECYVSWDAEESQIPIQIESSQHATIGRNSTVEAEIRVGIESLRARYENEDFEIPSSYSVSVDNPQSVSSENSEPVRIDLSKT